MSIEQQITELFEDQLSGWTLARNNYEALKQVQTKQFSFDGFNMEVQFNPQRVRSTVAPVEKTNIQKQDTCFLCEENRPEEQKGIEFEQQFLILCNPYPVFPNHLTIASTIHTPQTIVRNIATMVSLAKELPGYIVFYNGPRCGASAPMHLHFQAGKKISFPLYRDFEFLKNKYGNKINENTTSIKDGVRTFHIMQGKDLRTIEKSFYLQFLPDKKEPDFNILTWFENEEWTICVFNRKKHRPFQFYSEGNEQLLISPASAEMAGILITPRQEDFEKITKADIEDIFRQVN